MQYSILKNIEYPVRASSVELKKKNGWEATIIKFQSLWSSCFACSMIYPTVAYSALKEDLEKRNQHTFRKLTIKLDKKCYKLITWDDIEKDVTLKGHVNEILRKDGEPVIFDTIDMLVDIDGKGRPTIAEILKNEYKEVDYPNIDLYLNYNNKEDFKKRMQKMRDELRAREDKEYEEWERMMSDLCSGDEDYDDPRDWTEEDRVMYAIEHGNGECYGY